MQRPPLSRGVRRDSDVAGDPERLEAGGLGTGGASATISRAALRRPMLRSAAPSFTRGPSKYRAPGTTGRRVAPGEWVARGPGPSRRRTGRRGSQPRPFKRSIAVPEDSERFRLPVSQRSVTLLFEVPDPLGAA